LEDNQEIVKRFSKTVEMFKQYAMSAMRKPYSEPLRHLLSIRCVRRLISVRNSTIKRQNVQVALFVTERGVSDRILYTGGSFQQLLSITTNISKIISVYAKKPEASPSGSFFAFFIF